MEGEVVGNNFFLLFYDWRKKDNLVKYRKPDHCGLLVSPSG